MQINECVCGRRFISVDDAHNCHCTKKCCRRYKCEGGQAGKKPARTPETEEDWLSRPEAYERKCVTCGVGAKWFESFAPCGENCKGGMWFRSSKEQVDWPARWFQRACHLYPDQPELDLHHPDTEPRIHIKYCSLRCYNSPVTGHVMSERNGNRRRNKSYAAKSGRNGLYYAQMKRAHPDQYGHPDQVPS